jgi:mannose-6-phosphate isomerase-like protein (cupin superfamily)
MKLKAWILAATASAAAAVALAQTEVSREIILMPEKGPVTMIPHERVQASLNGKAGLHLFDSADINIVAAFRDKPGVVEVHERLTEVYYITAGEATMLIGGKNIGGKLLRAGEVRGGTVQGGAEYHVVKGDIIVVRPGLPTWFKEVPHNVSYLAVKKFAAPGT